MPSAFLTAATLRELLADLARRLHAAGVEGRLLIVGGAAMSLGHDARRTTRDVDGRFEPLQTILGVAHEMARERGLREDWLSPNAAVFLPRLEAADRVACFEHPGLTVELA